MKFGALLILCLLSLPLYAQYHESPPFFVTAEKGLICRKEPHATAQRVGKMPYGAIVELLQVTPYADTLEENGVELRGAWWKVRLDHVGYLYGLMERNDPEVYEDEAYVFSGYLEPLKKGKVVNQELKEEEFVQLRLKGREGKKALEKITGPDSIQEALEGRVSFALNDYRELIPDSLKFANGTRVKTNPYYFSECRIVAYYPEEDLLYCIGGHESDFSISLKTGETIETAGNPEYIQESPGGTMRLNGIYSGQECVDYFFQYKVGETYAYLCPFNAKLESKSYICWFEEFYWITESAFIFSYLDYTTDSEKGELTYYWGEIVRN